MLASPATSEGLRIEMSKPVATAQNGSVACSVERLLQIRDGIEYNRKRIESGGGELVIDDHGEGSLLEGS